MHLVLQRLFAVLGLLVLEVRRRKITGTILNLQIRAGHLDQQLAKGAVFTLVCRVKPENVISLRIVLNLLKRRPEIIRIKEGLAARIRRQRAEQLLRAEIRTELIRHRGPRVSRRAAQAALGRIAHRRQCLQATRIHGVDRQISLCRFIGCRTQARLIFYAVTSQAS